MSSEHPITKRGAGRSAGSGGGFTLTELIVALVVLVGVLLVASRIFSTTSMVASAGEAAADFVTEASAIERQLRADLEALAPEGVFSIRCVAVPNDINWPVLLNPGLPREATVRADQLVFFANGVQAAQTFRSGAGSSRRGQGTVSRVYYGHAFQLGDAGDAVQEADDHVLALDCRDSVLPWHDGPVRMGLTKFVTSGFDSSAHEMFASSGPPLSVDLEPFDARRWLLVRQPVALVNDDMAPRDRDAKTVYLDEVLTARSIFLDDPVIGPSPQVRDGRVDAAATQIGDIRRLITFAPGAGGAARPWSTPSGADADQFSLISSELVYYPRAEREAPGMHRVDQALTGHVIGSACSAIEIDWTYREGVGFTERPGSAGVPFRGIVVDRDRQQPWFGLADPAHGEGTRGVCAYGDEKTWTRAETIFPENVERSYTLAGSSPGNPVRVYEAIFGFNRDDALDDGGAPRPEVGYTPWPSAIRVTLTLHDSRSTMEVGREVQFVIDLPRRGAT